MARQWAKFMDDGPATHAPVLSGTGLFCSLNSMEGVRLAEVAAPDRIHRRGFLDPTLKLAGDLCGRGWGYGRHNPPVVQFEPGRQREFALTLVPNAATGRFGYARMSVSGRSGGRTGNGHLSLRVFTGRELVARRNRDGKGKPGPLQMVPQFMRGGTPVPVSADRELR